MQNDYMLYYICMLHTAFTVFIDAMLGIKPNLVCSFAAQCWRSAFCAAAVRSCNVGASKL